MVKGAEFLPLSGSSFFDRESPWGVQKSGLIRSFEQLPVFQNSDALNFVLATNQPNPE
jgi:hypothetical protein